MKYSVGESFQTSGQTKSSRRNLHLASFFLILLGILQNSELSVIEQQRDSDSLAPEQQFYSFYFVGKEG